MGRMLAVWLRWQVTWSINYREHANADVHIGSRGAQIGGAFGREDETRGGRECGFDSWGAYLCRELERMLSAGNSNLEAPST